jgi:hypothetical protein
LRYEGARLGFSSHFTIYDTDDSRRLMKECMKTLNIDEKVLSVKTVLGEISRAKDSLLSPDAYEQTPQVQNDFRLKKVATCYQLYQARLREADAMDFDDLLSRTVELLTAHADVLEKYRRRYRYIMVDEYQDTNYAQYRLVSLLALGDHVLHDADHVCNEHQRQHHHHGGQRGDHANVLEHPIRKAFAARGFVLLCVGYTLGGLLGGPFNGRDLPAGSIGCLYLLFLPFLLFLLICLFAVLLQVWILALGGFVLVGKETAALILVLVLIHAVGSFLIPRQRERTAPEAP